MPKEFPIKHEFFVMYGRHEKIALFNTFSLSKLNPIFSPPNSKYSH